MNLKDYQNKLNIKIYNDLNKIWPRLFPIEEQRINDFFEAHEDLIKELFDYIDPNYQKFIMDLKLKLIEIYNLPNNELLEIPSQDKTNELVDKKYNEWYLLNLYESQKQINQDKEKKFEVKNKNKIVQNEIINQITEKDNKKKRKSKLI